MSVHKLKGNIITREVWLDNKPLTPERSQKIVNHSPCGFAWGYGGSGPSQLALAVVLELTGEPTGYQIFKWNTIANLPQTDFETEFEIFP